MNGYSKRIEFQNNSKRLKKKKKVDGSDARDLYYENSFIDESRERRFRHRIQKNRNKLCLLE